MKITALIPAKNEELLLHICLNSIKSFVDEVIIYDDNSIDSTAKIAHDHGAIVIKGNYTSDSGWPEYEIRERLLSEARSRGATHIIALDADEAVTPKFAEVAKDYLRQLSPGDTLSMRWITLWKNSNQERVDGIFKDLYKNFAYCDDKKAHHQYAFLGVGRTPHSPSGRNLTVEYNLGGILHFQYASWERVQIKQAWYRCSELIKGDRSARRINNTYSTTLDGEHLTTTPLKADWLVELPQENKYLPDLQWQYQEILEFFQTHGVVFFEPLQIWHIVKLNEIFLERVGREPKPKTFPRALVYLNTIKNYIKQCVS